MVTQGFRFLVKLLFPGLLVVGAFADEGREHRQFQQQPVPQGGAMIRIAWIKRYDTKPQRTERSRLIMSLGIAAKTGDHNDYSVMTIWLIEQNYYALLDVFRGRWEYPDLKRRTIMVAEVYKPTRILVEDAGSGTALGQELSRAGYYTRLIAVNRDKITRMSIQSAKMEMGQVYFPRQAPWLSTLEDELMAFPHGMHDDQVDSISQALERGYQLQLHDV